MTGSRFLKSATFGRDRSYIGGIEASARTKRRTTDRRTAGRDSDVLHDEVWPLRDHDAMTNGVSPSSLPSTWHAYRLGRGTALHGRQPRGEWRRRTVGGIKSARHGDSSFAVFGFEKHTNCPSTFAKKNRLCYRRNHEADNIQRVAQSSDLCSAPVNRQPRYRRPYICVDGDVLLRRRLLCRRRVRQLRLVEILGTAPFALTLY